MAGHVQVLRQIQVASALAAVLSLIGGIAIGAESEALAVGLFTGILWALLWIGVAFVIGVLRRSAGSLDGFLATARALQDARALEPPQSA